VLLFLAVVGAVALVRKGDGAKSYKPVRVVLKAVGMTTLILVATLPAIIFPEYKMMATTGKYQVATVSYTYTDTSRIETYRNTGEKRKLNVRLWYPGQADGKYPLLVFSPGGLSEKLSNESLMNELASHGYAVISIDHTFQSLYTTDENGHTDFLDQGYLKEVNAEDAHSKKQQSYELYQKWMTVRMADINFVIDHTLAEANRSQADAVYKHVDPTNIGVMGHSLGGSAALGMGRVRRDVKAVMALESPFMYDIKGVKAGKFVFTQDPYPVPVLNVYSSDSWSHLGEWSQYAENYRLLSNPGATAFNVYIRGTGHLDLTDLAISSPILNRLSNGHESTTDARYTLKIINKVSVEFFDSYLKGMGRFTSGGVY
jgi:dienelactone hydrolase